MSMLPITVVYYGKTRQERPLISRSEMHNTEGKFTAWGIGKRKLQNVWRKILHTKQKQIICRRIFKSDSLCRNAKELHLLF